MTLEEKLARLKELEEEARKIIDGAERERFYEEKILPLSREVFLEKYQGETFEYLILSVGESIEPIVLSISLLKPSHVLFICTDRSISNIERIKKFIDYENMEFETVIVGKNNPVQVYMGIKDWYFKRKNPENCAIDGTGGTKVMAMGCALAASILNLKVFYVNNEYDKYTRKPIAGSEELIEVKNPYSVLGDLERNTAFKYFNSYNYQSAAQIFEKLRKSGIPEDSLMEGMSKGYALWESLEFDEAAEYLETAYQILSKNLDRGIDDGTGWGEKELNILKSQIKWVKGFSQVYKEKTIGKDSGEIFLESDCAEPMMLFLYENGMRRSYEKRYETASLLMYRVIEMIEQLQLYKNYKLVTANPDYSKLPVNEEILINEVNSIYKKVLEKDYKPVELKTEIPLFDGYVLLAALNDVLFDAYPAKGKITKTDILKKIRKRLLSRNNCILAHGFRRISEDDFMKIKEVADELLTAYFNGRPEFASLKETARFLTIKN